MSKVKMVAIRRHPFGAGFREVGAEYDADKNEAAILAGLGWAREAKVAAAKPAPAKVEKVVDAPKPAAKKAAKKQTYRTRDMKAKG